MNSIKQLLPPLEPCVAFDAAARHLSFTQATAKLNLSQAAVSQQIRNLESFLGVDLFIRGNRRVRLFSPLFVRTRQAAPKRPSMSILFTGTPSLR